MEREAGPGMVRGMKAAAGPRWPAVLVVVAGALVLAGYGGAAGEPAAEQPAQASAAGPAQASTAGGAPVSGSGDARVPAGGQSAGVPGHGAAVRVTGAWARAAEAGQNGTVYLRIENRGHEADRLVGVITDVAGSAELHESVMQDGVMKMRPLAGGVEVGPGEAQEFQPGGRHVMLLGLRKALRAGERFTVQLQFERAGTVSVPVEVQDAAAQGNPGMSHGQAMSHGT